MYNLQQKVTRHVKRQILQQIIEETVQAEEPDGDMTMTIQWGKYSFFKQVLEKLT